MKIERLLGDRVLVKRDRTEEMTKGGIHVPDKARKRTPTEGVVVMVSPACTAAVKPGDTVFFREYAGRTVYLEDEPHLILDADELGAVAEAA